MAEMRPPGVDAEKRPRQPIDRHLDDITAAFADHRDFTVFCFDKLRTEMVERFDAVDQRFDAVDQRFDAVDQRFDAIDQRFDRVDQRLSGVDQRLSRHEQLLIEVLHEVKALRK